jgi:hypothetical protein
MNTVEKAIKQACKTSEKKIKSRLMRRLEKDYAGDPAKLAQAKSILSQLSLLGIGGDILIAGKGKSR